MRAATDVGNGWTTSPKANTRRRAAPERKNGVGNIYCEKSQGTLLDTWKQYTAGEDEDTVIKNIYTPQTASGESSVVVAKKENLPSEQSREKLRDLRKKAMDREAEEKPNSFTTHEALVKYDPRNLEGSSDSGGTYYGVPSAQKVSHHDQDFVSSDEESSKRKERWFKKMFRTKH